jgi:hypothetical protein
MNRWKLAWCVAAAGVFAALGCGSGGEACEMLFVQTAQGMSSDEKQLTLKSPSPDILFFCDRPERVAGHLGWDAFVRLVSEGGDSFADDPPNAAVSVIGDKGEVTEVVVVLTERPTKRNDDIVFPMRVLDGVLQKQGGTTLLFIDPIGRPLSPTSVGGVHRRHVRRAIRR